MKSSPAWDQMSFDTTMALNDLASSEARIQGVLEQRQDYQAALAEKDAAQNRIQQMRAAGDDDPDQMTPVAEQELAAASRVTAMQTQALSSDSQWLSARTRLEVTAAGRTALENALHARLLNNPQWQAAKQFLDTPHC